MFFVPSGTLPKKRGDTKVSNNPKFESVWVARRSNFSGKNRFKMLLNVTENPLKANRIDFLEKLLYNIDNAIFKSLRIIMMVYYTFDLFSWLEQHNLAKNDSTLPKVFQLLV